MGQADGGAGPHPPGGKAERRSDPWPPGTRRAAGGGCAFRVGPHFSRPSARRELLRHRARCAQRSLPVPCTLQRCPILGGSDGLQEGVSKPTKALGQAQSERVVHSRALWRHPPRATAGSCPPLRCYRARSRMGARVMASGKPGASRRAVLGGATYSVVKVCVRLRGAARPEAASHQRHIPGARPARGGQSWTLCPRVRRHVPLARIGLAGWEKAEARAPRGV